MLISWLLLQGNSEGHSRTSRRPFVEAIKSESEALLASKSPTMGNLSAAAHVASSKSSKRASFFRGATCQAVRDVFVYVANLSQAKPLGKYFVDFFLRAEKPRISARSPRRRVCPGAPGWSPPNSSPPVPDGDAPTSTPTSGWSGIKSTHHPESRNARHHGTSTTTPRLSTILRPAALIAYRPVGKSNDFVIAGTIRSTANVTPSS